MTGPVSPQQKISAVVLSTLLFASVFFAHHKQRTPTATPFAHATSARPHLDAAQQAAYDAELYTKPETFDTTQQAIFNAEIDAVARQYTHTSPFNLTKETEVHVIAVHEADCSEHRYSDNCNGQSGDINIEIDYSDNPIFLILVAHNSVKWRINVTTNTRVEQVMISGHEPQSYWGLANTMPVTMNSHEHSFCATNCWRGGSDIPKLYYLTNDLLELSQKIENMTGKKITSLQYSHQSKRFDIYPSMPKLRY